MDIRRKEGDSLQKEHKQIRNIVKQCGYADDIADILCNLLRYMKENKRKGLCHATSAVLFVALSEIGHSPMLCIGETRDKALGLFDHSWIEMDRKIIDLAISMPIEDCQILPDPVVFDLFIMSATKHSFEYGVADGYGLDSETLGILNTRFIDYMDDYPYEKNGLWGVVDIIETKEVDIQLLRQKYADSKWRYVRRP